MCSSRKSEVVAMTDKETLKELQYADQLRVKPKVLRYMEVLLWLPKTNAAKGIYQKSSGKKHISPRKIEYTFSLLLDDRSISVLAYDLECLSLLWKQNGGINVLSEMRKELSADEAGFRELTDPMLYKLSSVFSGDYVNPARYPRFDE